MQQYKSALEEYKKKLTSDEIDPNEIKQLLILGNESSARMSWESLTNNGEFIPNTDKYIYHEDDGHLRGGITATNIYFRAESSVDVKGNILKVTYDNLKNSSYNGQKITKIVQIYHDITKTPNDPGIPAILVWSNPFNGFWYWHSDAISVDYHLYLENGEELNIPSTGLDGKHSDAWITVGSLNSGAWRTEGAALESAGKAYEFNGSTVTIHNNNWLYSDNANEWYPGNPETFSASGNPNDSKVADIPMAWDTGLSNPYAYFGAGVFNIFGKGYSIRYTTDHANGKSTLETWANMSTSIVKSNSGIIPPTIHYKDTEVVLECKFFCFYINFFVL